ncbi:hypothetical protein QLY67_015635 [Cronobacter turicensis]|uniref:hypothetical protein n=1 Tax=Cronobacter turicensis TaxID=413502 RepID=UPI0024AF4858|nr:hypothetical protein [Cronobacter turicensis]MDI7404241.1 hypothetical protein [Cronobacter turicensis]
MSEISEKRVEALASNILECHDVKPSEVKALAGLALPALRERAEPAAWISESNLKALARGHRSVYVKNEPILTRPVALYTAPPAPVVPEEIPASVYQVIYDQCEGFVDCGADAQAIWNACRAAMLQPVSQPYKLPVSTEDESKRTTN